MPQIAGKQIADGGIDTLQLADAGVEQNKIDAAALGDGLTGGSGTVLSADLEAAGAGTGGLSIDAGEIRVTAGDGIVLTAGGVAADLEAAGAGTGGLVFDTGEIRVSTGDGIELTAGGVAVDLEANGAGAGGLAFDAGELRVDAADGIVLSTSGVEVKPDVTTGGDTAAVTVAANGVGVDVTTLDGDHLDIDFTPANYTPDAAPAEAADVDDLAAHLKGIDTVLASVNQAIIVNADHELTPAASSGSDNFDTLLAITSTPLGMVGVRINGINYIVGDGSKIKDFYFTDDGGVSAQAISAIVATDELYYNPTKTSFDLSTADRIDIVYET